MEKTIEIPEGYEARIEGNKVIIDLKQSEDERIRKELIAFLKYYHTGQGNMVVYDNDWIAWLEKQGKKEYALKSSKDEDVHKFVQYIERQAKAYELNLPNRSYDIYGFAKDNLSWLEKQGEQNPKSANFIPTDCTSDAKYENRWHKVEDSLPDNNREVLCKDAIGNFFIGRYYNDGDYWEVSMYDEPDKSNKDNPPVIMWVNIPSCEQNLANSAKTCKVEQKPSIEICPHSIKSKSYLETGYQVEQNLAWSEDEKPLLEKFKQAVYDCAWGKVTCKAEGETKEEYANRWAEHFLLMVRDWADDYIDYAIQQKLRKSYDKGKEDAIKTNSPAWSEEDEKMLASFLHKLEVCTLLTNKEYRWADKKLKSLIPQNTWKPSDEQLEALEHSLGDYNIAIFEDRHEILTSLYQDLKKLKG